MRRATQTPKLRLNRVVLKELTIHDLRKVAGGPMHTESCHLG